MYIIDLNNIENLDVLQYLPFTSVIELHYHIKNKYRPYKHMHQFTRNNFRHNKQEHTSTWANKLFKICPFSNITLGGYNQSYFSTQHLLSYEIDTILFYFLLIYLYYYIYCRVITTIRPRTSQITIEVDNVEDIEEAKRIEEKTRKIEEN